MIRRLVLDVLKPHEPTILEVARRLNNIGGVDGVNILIYEIDKEVENAKIVMEGPDLKFDQIKKVLEDLGAAIHSIDEVAAGKVIVEEVKTPQDKRATWLR
jgi:hypothetical protein